MPIYEGGTTNHFLYAKGGMGGGLLGYHSEYAVFRKDFADDITDVSIPSPLYRMQQPMLLLLCGDDDDDDDPTSRHIIYYDVRTNSHWWGHAENR